MLNHLITQTNDNVQLRSTRFPCSSERIVSCMTSSSCCCDSVLMCVTSRLLLGHVATDASGILASGGTVLIIHLMGRLAVCCCLASDFECPVCRQEDGGRRTLSRLCVLGCQTLEGRYSSKSIWLSGGSSVFRRIMRVQNRKGRAIFTEW